MIWIYVQWHERYCVRRELHGYFSHSFHRVTLSYPSLHPNRRSPPGFLNQWISLRLLRSPALWPPHRAPKQRGCLYLGPMECSAPQPLPQLMVLRWRKRTRMKTMEFLKMVETKVVSINRCVTRETFFKFHSTLPENHWSPNVCENGGIRVAFTFPQEK